jgi:hypothetical protein
MRCGRPFRHAAHSWERYQHGRFSGRTLEHCDGGSDTVDDYERNRAHDRDAPVEEQS